MIIRVVKRTNPYVMIDKTSLEDARLSFRAKGILAYLLSRPDNWSPNRDQLAAISKEGRDAVAAALRELTKFGYFERRRERCEDGTFAYIGVIYEVPRSTADGESGNGESGNGKPRDGNSVSIISQEEQDRTFVAASAADDPFDSLPSKDDLAEARALEEIGECWNRQASLPTHRAHTVKKCAENVHARLSQGFTPEEICVAIENLNAAIESPETYWTHAYTLKEFLSREEGAVLERFSGDRDQVLKRMQARKNGNGSRLNQRGDELTSAFDEGAEV